MSLTLLRHNDDHNDNDNDDHFGCGVSPGQGQCLVRGESGEQLIAEMATRLAPRYITSDFFELCFLCSFKGER